MIQLVVNSCLLREFDEDKLTRRYAEYYYENDESVSNDTLIQQNLEKLLDWDVLGDKGLGIYCSKYESIKRKDWPVLIDLIKTNKKKIELLSRPFVKNKHLEETKLVLKEQELKEEKAKEHFSADDYTVSGRGKKAKPCTYEGRTYKSQQECLYKEGLTKWQLYVYLKNTNQI